MAREDVTPAGWVLYDGACGICGRWVPYWAPTLKRIGFDIAPMQVPWVEAKITIPLDQFYRDIQMLRADGALVSGADVYRTVLRAFWLTYPIYLVTVTPGFRQLFNYAYRTFADHRMAVSRACHVAPRTHT